ncbi:hypothetical protein SDC9_142097 [bioreactor metagenome]|uniref:Uncharacterized protein n=1 Tax=bioreactor metagenome TaxID=1076179 RepID=A0A645E0Q6_9ZZZZ
MFPRGLVHRGERRRDTVLPRPLPEKMQYRSHCHGEEETAQRPKKSAPPRRLAHALASIQKLPVKTVYAEDWELCTQSGYFGIRTTGASVPEFPLGR